MNLSNIHWEIAVTSVALVLLLADLLTPTLSKRRLGIFGCVAMGALLVFTFLRGGEAVDGNIWVQRMGGSFVFDELAIWGKQFALLATLLTMILSLSYFADREEHLVEYLVLQMAACVGMMLVVAAVDFISLFITMELMTVCFYILTSFQKRNPLSLEAGMKYTIYGAISSAILLYGIALVCGFSGEISFGRVAQYLQYTNSKLVLLGFLLILCGLSFKISAFPFHWWTPDVYEGAPTPTVSFLSSASKGIGFVVLVRLLGEAFMPLQHFWFPFLAVAAGGSILIGNLGALSQSNLKRLMGYSSISHTGYLLLGVLAGSTLGLSAMLYYLLAYLIANTLVFGVMCETGRFNPRQDIRGYIGFSEHSKLSAAAMLFGLLSLTGIPPLAGFFGKLTLFTSIFAEYRYTGAAAFVVLLVLALIGVVCSFYYYLGIGRAMYFDRPSGTEQRDFIRHSIPRILFVVLIICVILVGVYQAPWWEMSEQAVRSMSTFTRYMPPGKWW
jgi:NADH-quinone oxidoreductase subunit N